MTVLPEDLTHSPLQLATLQETFGPLGEIAEIFLFEPRPEGFIIFHDSLQIPNFDGILSPQHILDQKPEAPITSDQFYSSAPLPLEETGHWHTRDTIFTRPRPSRSHCGGHRAEPGRGSGYI